MIIMVRGKGMFDTCKTLELSIKTLLSRRTMPKENPISLIRLIKFTHLKKEKTASLFNKNQKSELSIKNIANVKMSKRSHVFHTTN